MNVDKFYEKRQADCDAIAHEEHMSQEQEYNRIEELLASARPCPFCGRSEQDWERDAGMVSVKCGHCESVAALCEDHEKAVAFWNGAEK